MRHLWSLIAGVLAVPLVWLILSVGQLRTGTQFAKAATEGSFVARDFIPPFLLLVAAGLVLGVIACLRVSPVGPVVAGVAFLAPYAALLIRPQDTYDRFAYTFDLSFVHGKTDGDLTTPLTSGIAPVIGALLLVAVVSAKRWRRWPAPATAAGDAGAVAPTSPAPADTTEPLPAAPSVVPAEEPVGTVVWTREPVESDTVRQPTGAIPVGNAGTTSGKRGRSPWTTPPGDDADGSQT
ncbi:MAG TPA: hypothetical protein VHA75_10550 [Rugosimonospora sp.]|nr:hypothetical protein [Rugosimonospora sp.]